MIAFFTIEFISLQFVRVGLAVVVTVFRRPPLDLRSTTPACGASEATMTIAAQLPDHPYPGRRSNTAAVPGTGPTPCASFGTAERPRPSFAVGAVFFFADMLSRASEEQVFAAEFFSWLQFGASCTSTSASSWTSLVMYFMLLIARIGSLISIYSVGYWPRIRSAAGSSRISTCTTPRCCLLVFADNYLGGSVGAEGVEPGVPTVDRALVNHRAVSRPPRRRKTYIVDRVGDVGLAHRAGGCVFGRVGSISFGRSASPTAPLLGEGSSFNAIGLLLLLAAYSTSRTGAAPVVAASDAIEEPAPVLHAWSAPRP